MCALTFPQYRFFNSSSSREVIDCFCAGSMEAYHSSTNFCSSGEQTPSRYLFKRCWNCSDVICVYILHDSSQRFFPKFLESPCKRYCFSVFKEVNLYNVDYLYPLSAYSHHSDDDLLKAIRNDDEKAFAELFNRNWKKAHT